MMAGECDCLNPVTVQVLVLEALPLRGKAAVENFFPADGCLVFDQLVEGSVVVFVIHRGMIKAGLDSIHEDGNKHLLCVHFNIPLCWGSIACFRHAAFTMWLHFRTWSLSSFAVLYHPIRENHLWNNTPRNKYHC
jgi:hypothetical protein